jgi:hypothetical protein
VVTGAWDVHTGARDVGSCSRDVCTDPGDVGTSARNVFTRAWDVETGVCSSLFPLSGGDAGEVNGAALLVCQLNWVTILVGEWDGVAKLVSDFSHLGI